MKVSRISFNSIIVPKLGSHQLTFHVLHSYLIHKGIAGDFHFYFNPFETCTPSRTIAHDILTQRADMAAFSVSGWNERTVVDACERLKRENPGLLIVLGGPNATFRADVLMATGAVDIIVKGAGEDVFYRVLGRLRNEETDLSGIENLLYRRNGQVLETREVRYFDISRQNYPLVIAGKAPEMFYYETSRGCPFACRFCAWHSRTGQMSFYPREKIETDLKTIFHRPEIHHLVFCDSDIFIRKSHGLWLLALLRKLNDERKKHNWPAIQINIESNPQFFDDDIIDTLLFPDNLFRAILFGLQTADEQVSRRYLNRRFDRDKYFDNLRRLFHRAIALGVHKRLLKVVMVEVIYGLPGDTHEGFKRTMETILSKLEFINYYCYPFQVLPGSYFWDHAEDFYLVYEKDPPHRFISSDTYPAEDMERSKQLVFFLMVLSFVLKGIRRFIDKRVKRNRIDAYEKVIDHIAHQYPEFISTLYRYYNPKDDVGSLFDMMALIENPQHVKMRDRIIRETKQAVMNGL